VINAAGAGAGLVVAVLLDGLWRRTAGAMRRDGE